MSRIIVYGDIHGCLDEFKTLRKKIKIKKSDREIVAGDFLNKGPYSNKVLKYLRKKSIEAIQGNHENKYIQYIKKGTPLSVLNFEIYENFSKKDLKYLEALPIFIKVNNLTILHAGITNSIDLKKSNKADIESTLCIKNLKIDKTYKFWGEVYDGNQGIVVYGHEPTKEVRVNKYSIGLDTGCVYGGKLSALIVNNTKKPLKNYEIIQVKSKQEKK